MQPSTRRWLFAGAVAAIAVLALVSFRAPQSRAQSFTVTRSDDPPPDACSVNDCSLREAIIAANASPGPDTITLQIGIYALSIPGRNEHASATGDLDITGDLTMGGAGAALTVIDGGALDRVFDVTESITVQVSGLAVQGGDSADQDGGGIRNLGALTLNDTSVSGNHADDAGGINNLGALTLINSTVGGNQADDAGGGIFNHQGAALTLTGSTVSGNSSGFSAGGISNFETLALTNSTVSGNTTGGNGGGISNFGGATITNSTISGNSTAFFDGGGISNEGALSMASSTLSDNSAGGLGGGIFNYQGTVTIKNTIIASSASGGDCGGDAVVSSGHNLDGDGTCGLSAGGDLSATDPQLGPLADNGGPTLTHAPLPGSPAVDAGSEDCPPPDTDQRAVARPLDGDGDQTAACDMGAVETGPNDSDGDGCTDEREAGPDPALGGGRDPNWFWDFFDVPAGAALTRNRNVTGEDIFAVIGRFNATDLGVGDFDRNSDPLSTPNPLVIGAHRQNYHPAYDRSSLVGPDVWDLGPPDGAITGLEIFAVIAQFGHSCS